LTRTVKTNLDGKVAEYFVKNGDKMTEVPILASEVRFFSGSSNPQLAENIASKLGVPLDATNITRFSNDNMYIQLSATVRYRRVFIVQSLSQPVNDHLMELLMMLDIARGAAASEVHAIIPYYSFGRSDKKDAPRISITARLVADLLKTAGATHVMSMMFHSPQVHGFFGIPTDPLSSRLLLRRIWDRPSLRRVSRELWTCQLPLETRSAYRIQRSLSAGW
jgi:ribose-phosphate pyrophosphokinase